MGLVACNTIAEGDTRQVGLERMVQQGGSIIAANPNMPWPGSAAVVISLVFFYKNRIIEHAHLSADVPRDGHWHGHFLFNDKLATVISPFLSQQEEWSPKVLKANANQSFQGSIVLGLGFTMSEEEAQAYIAKDPKNAEVLFPYLNGEDLNSSPTQKASRWVINFFDWPLNRSAQGNWETMSLAQRSLCLSTGNVPSNYPKHVASDFPDILEWVIQKVKPEREEKSRSFSYRNIMQNWWKHWNNRMGLYHAIGQGYFFACHPAGWDMESKYQSKVLVVARVSKTLAFAFASSKMVFSDNIVVLSSSEPWKFGIMQSNIHGVYAWQYSSKLKNDLRYCPSDIYETFPFPILNEKQQEELGKLSTLYSDLRKEIMSDYSIGLTAFYKRYHLESTELPLTR